MTKNFEWKKKEGENWYVLEIKDMNNLTLNQALKVQEMWDNKHNQRLQVENQKLQIKMNKMIVVLTVFTVFVGLFNLSNLYYEIHNNQISDILFLFWAIVFLILSLIFLGISIPEKIIDKLKNFITKFPHKV